VRRVVLEYFGRAGVELRPEHEVHNVVHAISMITSTRAVMLLPAYTKGYLPESITTRPVQGEVPTLDLVLACHKANKSPILKLLLSRVGKFAGAAYVRRASSISQSRKATSAGLDSEDIG
jgi:LysR family hca operon transcriptional activator